MLSRFGLADPANTKTVRIRDGVPAVTDGPFGEAKEQLAGVFLVDSTASSALIEFSGPLAEYSTSSRCGPLMDDGAGEEM